MWVRANVEFCMKSASDPWAPALFIIENSYSFERTLFAFPAIAVHFDITVFGQKNLVFFFFKTVSCN